MPSAPGAHGRCDCHLHGTAVSDLAFNLTGDGVGHDLSIKLGALYLEDVDLYILVGDLLEFFLEFVDFGTSLADDQARTRGAYGDGGQLESALDYDARYARLGKTHIEIFPQFVVLEQVVTVFLAEVPVGIPAADDAQTVAYWIYFLSHSAYALVLALSLLSIRSTKRVTWLERLRMR